MRNRNRFCYFGYAAAFAILLLIVFTDFPLESNIALAVLFSCVFSVSHITLLHDKMIQKDKDYQVHVLDERNISIKEKAGNISNMVTLCMLGLATVIFLLLDYVLPAIITGIIVAVQPLILILISTAIEKKM